VKKILRFIILVVVPLGVGVLGAMPYWPRKLGDLGPNATALSPIYPYVLGGVTLLTTACGIAGFLFYKEKPEPNTAAAEAFMTMFKLGFGGLVGLLGGGMLA
jgi:hypothetical protein